MSVWGEKVAEKRSVSLPPVSWVSARNGTSLTGDVLIYSTCLGRTASGIWDVYIILQGRKTDQTYTPPKTNLSEWKA